MKFHKAIVIPYLFLTVFLSQSAYAYLDPGNGSIILQVILGGVAGLAVAFKYYWQQIVLFFKPKKAADETGGKLAE